MSSPPLAISSCHANALSADDLLPCANAISASDALPICRGHISRICRTTNLPTGSMRWSSVIWMRPAFLRNIPTPHPCSFTAPRPATGWSPRGWNIIPTMPRGVTLPRSSAVRWPHRRFTPMWMPWFLCPCIGPGFGPEDIIKLRS